jgi:acetylornithine deacetylase/succinyl-diaminopimelate desuccinylase-like protein
VAVTDLRDEVTDLLQRLIRVDTTNPPGNETAAAELLRDYLAANGVESELIAKTPDRANLVARIPGGGGPSLLLLCHTDVVYADPADWQVPPFAGSCETAWSGDVARST